MSVSKEIYAIYKNSYQKMYRDQCKEIDRLIHYENADDLYPYLNGNIEKNPIDDVYNKDLKRQLYEAMENLSEEELFIILHIYFFDESERNIANYLGIGKTTLHYRKTQILKKLRKIIYQSGI